MYEPLIVLESARPRRTSLAAEPQLLDARLEGHEGPVVYHLACYKPTETAGGIG